MADQPPTTEEPVEEPSEPLKYKTWVLKVSVHCEGCKKKVKKILHGIEGVYTVDVDTKLHKATVTGNVDPEILIRKLEKAGKHAELWPEKAEQKESRRSKKKKDKQNDQDDPETNENVNSAPGEKENPETTEVEVVNPAKTGGCVQFKEAGVEAKMPKNSPESDGAADKAASNGGGSGGSRSKRRKKKGNKGNSGNGNEGQPSGNDNGNTNDGPVHTQPPPHGQGTPAGAAPLPPYRGPPCGYPMYDHTPPPYYAPPVYAVSNNTAYPPSNYTTSYYTSPRVYSYAYVYKGSDSLDEGPSPSDWNNGGESRPSDTFEMFSDENPNACSMM